MRRAGPRPLNAALDGLVDALRPATTLARVQEAWPRAVGPALSAEAQPVSERRGTVTVSCGSSVWAQELALMAPELVARLNAAIGTAEGGGPVDSLRFVTAARPAAAHRG